MKIRKVLVSQPKPTTEKSPYFDLAEKYNLKLEFRPFIKVEGVTAKEFRQERINILDHSAIISQVGLQSTTFLESVVKCG